YDRVFNICKLILFYRSVKVESFLLFPELPDEGISNECLEDYGDASPFMFENSPYYLFWKVEGAYQVDIHPIGKNLKGGIVRINMDMFFPPYMLVAHGLFKKSYAKLEFRRTKIVRFNLKGESLFDSATSKKLDIWNYSFLSRSGLSPKLIFQKLDLSTRINIACQNIHLRILPVLGRMKLAINRLKWIRKGSWKYRRKRIGTPARRLISLLVTRFRIPDPLYVKPENSNGNNISSLSGSNMAE